MQTSAIFDDPGFILGLALHLERKKNEYLSSGLQQEARKIAEALHLLNHVLIDMRIDLNSVIACRDANTMGNGIVE